MELYAQETARSRSHAHNSIPMRDEVSGAVRQHRLIAVTNGPSPWQKEFVRERDKISNRSSDSYSLDLISPNLRCLRAAVGHRNE
jgi:FMN phosphatase YigB (HAD superfamily)